MAVAIQGFVSTGKADANLILAMSSSDDDSSASRSTDKTIHDKQIPVLVQISNLERWLELMETINHHWQGSKISMGDHMWAVTAKMSKAKLVRIAQEDFVKRIEASKSVHSL